MRGRELAERGQLDDGLDLALEQHGQHDDVAGPCDCEAGVHLDQVGRNFREQDALAFLGALADQPFAQAIRARPARFLQVSIAREALQPLAVLILRDQVHHALVGVDERRQLGEQHLRDRREVALALHHAAELREVRLQPVLLGVALGGPAQVADHRVDVVLEVRDLAAGVDLDRARQVALRDRRRDLRDRAHLRRQVRGEQVHVCREVLPGAGCARHVRLAAEPALDAHLACDGRHLLRKRRERRRHAVDRVRECGHFSFRFDREALAQLAVCHVGHDLDDAAHLVRQVCGHDVDVVGEILPGARDARHDCLAAELALGADFARHARDFGREAVQLVHHRVDGVLEREDLALDVHGDLARQVAARIAVATSAMLRTWPVRLPAIELTLSVRSFQVPATPGTIAWPPSLPSVPTSRATRVTSAAKPFSWSTIVLMVSLSCRISPRTSAGSCATGRRADRGRHLRDVAHLRGQVAGHRVDVVGEVFPGARDARHVGLAAELPSVPTSRATRVTSAAKPFSWSTIVFTVCFSSRISPFTSTVILRDRSPRATAVVTSRNVAHLSREVARHRVDVVGEVLPGARDARHVGLAAERAFRADLARHARHFGRETVQLVDHRVDGLP